MSENKDPSFWVQDENNVNSLVVSYDNYVELERELQEAREDYKSLVKENAELNGKMRYDYSSQSCIVDIDDWRKWITSFKLEKGSDE